MDGTDQQSRARLLDAARRLVAAGNAKFSISALCREAGVSRPAFKTHFPDKATLLAALVQPVEAPKLVPAPEQPAAQPDAWLERRLRVFERALTALEARAEATAREQAQLIARLEEQIAGRAVAPAAPSTPAREPRLERKPIAAAIEAVPAPVAVAPVETAETVVAPDMAVDAGSADAATAKAEAVILPVEAPQAALVSKADMAEILAGARRAAQDAAPGIAGTHGNGKRTARLRWLALGGLSLLAALLCIRITLGDAADATQRDSGSGITHRHVASQSFGRMEARADNGDPTAQTGLALAYLRGDHVPADPRAAAHWSSAAALSGQPLAQYLLGTLYDHGDGVAADSSRAFGYYAAAAEQGNLKAMHNLAIAYAHGLGTQKDSGKAAEWFARAATRGYVDSAFDLAVLYERGEGVQQNLQEALKWYSIAAREGDAPSRGRAEVLRQQLPTEQALMAADAAQSFIVLAPEAAANAPATF